MGRLLLFLELAAAACAVGFFSLWGTVSPALAITPIAIVVFIPLVAALGVWPPRVLARALLDGWGSDPLRKPAPQSAAIWRFLERMVPLSGAIGVGIFAVLTLSFIPVGGPGEAAREPGTGWSWPSAFAPEPAAGAGCGAPWRRDATPVRRRGPAPRRKRPQKGRILQTEY